MVSKNERKRLKKVLGNNYTNAVIQELQKTGATNKFGKPYSAESIRIVFNGVRNSTVIEAAIYKAAETQIAKNLLEHAKRKSILINQ